MLDNLDISKITGLTTHEADSKLKSEGYNELASDKKGGILPKLSEIVREPVFILLIACATIYFLLGDVHEATMLSGFVIVVIGITLYQGSKTDKALEALRDLSSPRALVIRDSGQKRIAGREVVSEDIIVLAEGDRIPADARIISCNNLMVDESLLTGESVPVRKSEDDNAKEPKPGGDDTPFIFSGTLVVGGAAIAKVMSTGSKTEMGKIGKSLQNVETEETELQKEVGSLVKNFAFGSLIFCSLIIIVYGLTRGDWLTGFLTGITLAMSILPEEFPVVLTIFIALGAWRMSREKVLARRQHAIHELGRASVLCVDKTGTLTMNKMTVKQLCSNDCFHDADDKNLPENFHELVEFGILSSQKDPFDPMEKALVALSKDTISETEHIHSNWQLIRQYPLSKNLMAVSHVWKSLERQEYVIAAKGAPEAVIDLCHMDTEKAKHVHECVIKMADKGLRVIGVAKAMLGKTELPDGQHDFTFEFLGLVGFADPVRPGVAAAVKECHEAGIRVIMITGDYPGTAKNIAHEIGLPYGNLITGPELDAMDDIELAKKINETGIFARVVPEQKLRIVNALKKTGQTVAMTGDGVNDAPALKSANIGIAMGERGTDVAREAASVVILDDDFSSIVKGVSMGRRIFDNIRKAMTYTLAVHIPIAGLTMLSVILGWPLLLLPIHIVFLELIIDPACSIVFEAEKGEKEIMKRKPKHFAEKIFEKKTVAISIAQGLMSLAVVVFVFYLSVISGFTESQARTMCFITLISSNIGLIITNISWTRNVIVNLLSKNRALWVTIIIASIFLAAINIVPFLRDAFKFGVLPIDFILAAVLIGLSSIIWFEILKLFWKRNRK